MALALMPLLRTAGAAPADTIPTPRRQALLALPDAGRRKEASAWLAASGFEVTAVEDVGQALDQIGRLHPAVVLADTALRDERGRGLCQAVRQLREGSAVPVLAFCSGSREVAAALEAGASDVLDGPFDGRVAARRADQLARLSETRRRAGKGAGGERATAQDGRGRASGGALARALRRAHRPARRRAARAHPRERPGRGVREEPGGGGAVRHRAPGPAQHAAWGARARTPSSSRWRSGSSPVLRSEEMRRTGAGPSMSMAARLGGGLFAVMLTGLPGGPEAKAAVRLLLDRLSGRYVAGDEEIVLSTERRHRTRPRRRADRGVAAPEGGAGGPRGAGERGCDPLLPAVLSPHDGAEPGHHAPAPQRARPRRAPAPLPAVRRRVRAARPRRARRSSAGSAPSSARFRRRSSSPWPKRRA